MSNVNLISKLNIWRFYFSNLEMFSHILRKWDDLIYAFFNKFNGWWIMRTEKTIPVSEVPPFHCLSEENLNFQLKFWLSQLFVYHFLSLRSFLEKDWHVFSKMGNVTFRLSLTKTTFLTDDWKWQLPLIFNGRR